MNASTRLLVVLQCFVSVHSLLDKSVPTIAGVANMLLFFLLCGMLQTLLGKPLPSPLGPSFEVAANATCITSCEQCPAVPDDGGHQLRSVYDIVQSCLFTIFACVWTSIHPNINGPRDSWWTCMKRRAVITLYAVIAPEAILLWALRQHVAAKDIAKSYNRDFETLGETEMSVWAKFRQNFQPLPKSTTRRGIKQPWTITHGFFVQMGGFILYDGEYPKRVLDYYHLRDLLEQKAIEAPTVTERDLQDKSRGDAISKAIVLLQATWFVFQCIVRASQHLPLSELEVLTLAFAVMNAAIYTAWWSKPQGVDTAICVLLKQGDIGADNSRLAPRSPRQADNQHFSNIRPLITPIEQEPHENMDSWLARMLQKDRKNYNSIVFHFARLPYRITLWVARPFWKFFFTKECSADSLRMPAFYVPFPSTDLPEYLMMITGVIFGAIHLLAWASEFPLLRDRILWQISAVVLTVAPFTFLLSYFLEPHLVKVLENIRNVNYGFTILVLFPLYIVARLVVIAIAFKGILHPPHDVLLDISWTRYIPHF